MNAAQIQLTASTLSTGDTVIITTADRKNPFRGTVTSVEDSGAVFVQLKRGELSLEREAVSNNVFAVRWNANPVQVDVIGLALAN